MKSYNLYFFRHGITKGNLNAQYIGHTDLPLTTDSINELHSIKAKYHYPKVDAVFSSPLKRCKDSAEIMFPDNTIITIDDFIEYNFGEFEQCTADDLKDNEDFKNWIGGDISAKTIYAFSEMHRPSEQSQQLRLSDTYQELYSISTNPFAVILLFLLLFLFRNNILPHPCEKEF